MLARAILVAILACGARRGFAQASGERQRAEDGAGRVEVLRSEAAAEIGRGEFGRARAHLAELLRLAPHDAAAQRDAGRIAMAQGDFEYGARVLEQSHHGDGHHRDPELHYLRGEALYELGRTEEARNEHRIAELEVGSDSPDRLSRLWLARIQARRGHIDRADALYETLWPATNEAPDAEVALNQADAHLLVQDWPGAARVLRRYLVRAPDDARARRKLAWALEAQGQLDAELGVRANLAAHEPSPADHLDYGRALERAGDYREALRAYQAAVDLTAGEPNDTLLRARDRMRDRLTPEVTAGVLGRSDPIANGLHLQAGVALPLGSRHLVSVLAWHDESHGGYPIASAASSAIGASLVLGARWGGRLTLGGAVRDTNQIPSLAGRSLQVSEGPKLGGVAEAESPITRFARVDLRGEVQNQWSEAPVTVQEGGAATGLTGHLFGFPVPSSQRVIIDTGVQARTLRLTPRAAGEPRPESRQVLAWAGADFVLWHDPGRVLTGEILDETLVRQTELANAVTLSFRHYELFSHTDDAFSSRITLVPRSSVENASVVVRDAPGRHRRFGYDFRAGLGYDRTRNLILAQGGGSLMAATGASGRVGVSYDVAQETATGLTGRRHTGWLTYHVDL